MLDHPRRWRPTPKREREREHRGNPLGTGGPHTHTLTHTHTHTHAHLGGISIVRQALNALYDRFLLRSEVAGISDRKARSSFVLFCGGLDLQWVDFFLFFVFFLGGSPSKPINIHVPCFPWPPGGCGASSLATERAFQLLSPRCSKKHAFPLLWMCTYANHLNVGLRS